MGDEFAAADVTIDAAELAAHRLARARLLPRGQAALAACPTDLVVSRAVAALGRAAPLRGFAIDVREVRDVRELAPVAAPCALAVAARVLGCSDVAPGVCDLSLAVTLRRGGAAALGFALDLRLRRRAAA